MPIVLLVLIVSGALLAPFLTTFSPQEGLPSDRLLTPGALDAEGERHLFGTDQAGRDVLTRILYGARVSLVVGVVGVVMASVLGTLVGLMAGMGPSWLDALLMRLVDVWMSIPAILVAILIATTLQPSLTTVFLAIGVYLWSEYARLVRGEVLALKSQDFVALARVAGCSTRTIALRHVVPNVLPTVLVVATVHVGLAIILESSLSFLGVGLPPSDASWGTMVDEGRSYLGSAWWLSMMPGTAIFVTVLSFNMIGDWARVRFDPRLHR